jgi:PAS domain S-box-containing protein
MLTQPSVSIDSLFQALYATLAAIPDQQISREAQDILQQIQTQLPSLQAGALPVEGRPPSVRAIHQSEEWFHQVTEHIDEAVWLTSPEDDKLLYISSAYERIWGRPSAELYAYHPLAEWLNTVHPEDRERIRAVRANQKLNGYDEVFRIERPDGAIRWVHTRAFPVRNQQGETYRMVGVSRDITDWKESELEVQRLNQQLEARVKERTAQLEEVNAALSRAEARQRALLNAVPDLVLRMSTDGTYLDFSDPHNQLHLPKERLIGSNVRDWPFPPAAIERVLAAYQRAVDTGEIQTTEYSVTTKSGELSYESRIVRCGPNEVVSIARDVTNQKQLEVQRIRQTRLTLFRAELNAIINGQDAQEVMMQACTDALVRHLDGAFARIWLLEPGQNSLLLAASAGQYTNLDGAHSRLGLGEHMIGRIALSRQPQLTNTLPEDPLVSDHHWVVREGIVAFAGYPMLVENRLVGVLALFARQPLPDDTLDVLSSAAIVIAQGIERRRAEAAQHKSAEYYRSIFEQVAVGIAHLGLDGRFLLVNQKLCDIVGYTRAEMGNLTFQAITHSDDLPPNLAYIHRLLRGEIPNFTMEKRYRRKDGKHVFTNLTLTLVRDQNNLPNYFVAVLEDISERKQAECEIRKLNAILEERVQQRTEQLAAINQELEAFCYSVSHDLRAPLRAINGFSQALLEDYGCQLDAEGHNYLSRVRMASQRMGALIDDLLNLSRVTRHQLLCSSVNLSSLADQIVRDLQAAEPERKVQLSITPNLIAEADENLMRVVLENLLHNAWKYTSKHASAQIEFGCCAMGGQAIYFVKDDGAGFDMSYASKLFGAFQRLHTAAEFEGSGIGLATVQRIIHRHGGRIWAEGALEQGATFYFSLA